MFSNLRSSVFGLPSSVFGLPSSVFRLRLTSDAEAPVLVIFNGNGLAAAGHILN